MTGVIASVRSILPLKAEKGAALDRSESILRDHGNSTERLKSRGDSGRINRHDPQHARHLQGFGRIENLHLGAINGRSRDDRKRHSLDLSVDTVDGLAGGDVEIVDQGEVFATDVAKLARGFEDKRLAHRNGPRRRTTGKNSKAEPPAAGPVHHLVIVRPDFRDGNAPPGCGFFLEHPPGRRADTAQWLEMVSHAA